jgi:hypothetical protein
MNIYKYMKTINFGIKFFTSAYNNLEDCMVTLHDLWCNKLHYLMSAV